MRISNVGLQLIKKFEGLVLYSYDDRDSSNPRKRIRAGDHVAGTLTIGYGNIEHAIPGLTIDEATAEKFLQEDLMDSEEEVLRRVYAPLSQNQYDALVAFEFNTGGMWLTDRKGRSFPSKLTRLLNDRNYTAAAIEFESWVHDGGKVVAGLVARRKAERNLFEKKDGEA